MKSIKIAVLAMAFLAASTVFAKTVETEFFWQAGSDTNIVTPEIDFQTRSAKADTTGAKETKISGPVVKVTYERGFTEALSAGATFGYAAQSIDDGDSTTDNVDLKGMDDLDFFVKGQHSFAEGSSLHYGAHLRTSIGNREIEVATAGTTIGAQSGGSTVTPYVGYTMLMGSNVLGAQASIDLLKTERTTITKTSSGDTESKDEGGADLRVGAFFEMPFSGGMVGYSVGFLSTTEEKNVVTKVIDEESSSFLELMVYPTWQATPDTAVIGSLAYRNLLSQDNVDSASEIEINVGGRFMF